MTGLKYQYYEKPIKNAESKVSAYFSQSGASLNDEELLNLHALVVTGHPVDSRHPLIKLGFTRSLEWFEVYGFLKLVRSSVDDELVTVDIPEMRLHGWAKRSRMTNKLIDETYALISVCNNVSGL